MFVQKFVIRNSAVSMECTKSMRLCYPMRFQAYRAFFFFQGPVSSTDLLEPAVQPRHLSHLRISPLWQMFIQHSDAEIGQQLYPPATPPTPAKQESHAKHASKASRSASRSGSTSSVPRSSGSRSGSPPGSSSEPGAGQLETAGPVLDWLYGLKTFHHELPRLPGESHGSSLKTKLFFPNGQVSTKQIKSVGADPLNLAPSPHVSLASIIMHVCPLLSSV